MGGRARFSEITLMTMTDYLILAAGLTRALSSDTVGFPAVAGFGDFP